ncbi:mitochondrial hydrolase YKR070W-like isoform X3 [Miscanthus floridulus]|uniref:mitochondrial hydrolase YKR070W-like isoform X3 n=1 Tax=Miscanthus floridulus TaxID=154761 RepID=UPI003459F420
MRGFRFALVRAARSRSRAELHTVQRHRPSDLAQRFSHSASAPARPSFGIAFDIDGVILRGRSPIGGTPRAIRRLYSEEGTLKIPFLFLTNGGGVPEHRRALELSQLLGVNISPKQVVHGHSPYRELVKRFEDDLIVAVGKGEPAVVMSEYGFRLGKLGKQTVTCLRKCTHHMMFIQSELKECLLSAILLIGEEIYRYSVTSCLLVDFLGLKKGINLLCILQLMILNTRINDHPLKYTSYGKPNPFVFKNAANILEKLVLSMYPNSQTSMEVKDCQFSTIYMVGDNPKVDINGAMKAGHPWSSVLTRTGVFRGKDNDPQFPADAVVDTVEDAINYILEKECVQ